MPIFGWIFFGISVAFCIRVMWPSRDPDKSGVAGSLFPVLGAVLGGSITYLLGGEHSDCWFGSILGGVALGIFDEFFFFSGLPAERCKEVHLIAHKVEALGKESPI